MFRRNVLPPSSWWFNYVQMAAEVQQSPWRKEQNTTTKRWYKYRGADKSLARPGRKQANVSVRMAWISFGALPCRGKKWWQLASRCCWNRARPWHTSELLSFLIGLRTYQHPGIILHRNITHTTVIWCFRYLTTDFRMSYLKEHIMR